VILQTMQLTGAQVLALFTSSGQASPGTEFVFQQGAPAAQWTIVHNLGMHPSVRVVDSSGTLVEGQVTYQDANTVVLNFSGGFAGVAYLS
jgi:hypothetical protein